MAERLGNPPGQVGQIGLDLAATQPVVYQSQEPARQVGIQRGSRLDIEEWNDILMKLENSFGIIDLARPNEPGQLLVAGLGAGRLKLLLEC
jgi:hypothetical protein